MLNYGFNGKTLVNNKGLDRYLITKGKEIKLPTDHDFLFVAGLTGLELEYMYGGTGMQPSYLTKKER